MKRWLSKAKDFLLLRSLQSKMFLICMVISNTVVLCTSQLIIQRAASVIVDNAYNYIHESMVYAESNLDAMLQDGMAINLSIVSNRQFVLDAMRSDSTDASYESFRTRTEVGNYLASLVSGKDYISRAVIIGSDGKSYYSGGDYVLRSIAQADWFLETMQSPGLRIFYDMTGGKQILLCRPIRYSQEVLGISVVEMDFDSLNSVYGIAPLQDVKIATFSDDGRMIFSNLSASQDSTLNSSAFTQVMKEYTPTHKIYTVHGEKMLAVVYKSSVNQLTTIGFVSYDHLLTQALTIREQMFFVIVASTLAATIASWLFARLICRNLERLQHSMIRVRDGDLTVRSHVKARDETGTLAEIFNTMMYRIENLLRDVQHTEEQKRQAEQNVLEAQIQPHFIYNILNSITYVAHLHNQPEIEGVSAATVQLLRGVLDVRESFVPIWQECDYIEQYLRIQKFKLQQDFTAEWDVEPSLWNCRIPKLLLQPIVENAVLHGIAHMPNGKISIQISREGEHPCLLMKVTDNGKGMSELEVKNLLLGCGSEENGTAPQFRKVGFANVQERIQLIYGKQYGAKVTSFPGAFTCVEIRLPFREEDSSCTM